MFSTHNNFCQTIPNMALQCSSMLNFLVFKIFLVRGFWMFGMSNIKFLAFGTPHTNALRALSSGILDIIIIESGLKSWQQKLFLLYLGSLFLDDMHIWIRLFYKENIFVVFSMSLLGPLFLDNMHILDYIILQINPYQERKSGYNL